MELNETFLDSCKAIVKAIVDDPNDKNRELKYFDFLEKFKGLNKQNEIEPKEKIKYDVIIFTVVPVEFETLDKLLNITNDEKKEDHDLNGLWYYGFEVPRTHQRRSLKALVTLVGVAGDVNCSLACGRAFQKFSCDLAILCGIAAGVSSEIKKYSTVVSQSIVNYEFQRVEKDGVTYRPIPYSIDRYNENVTTKLKLHNDKWRTEFLEFCKQILPATNGQSISQTAQSAPHNGILNSIKNFFGGIKETVVVSQDEVTIDSLKGVELKSGIIASGAKLLADGKTLQELRNNIPIQKGIIAAEMEGSGFSPACIEFKRNWLVFRGISDYGEADKNSPVNKKFQNIAAASAVTSMMYYLTNLYRTPEERGDAELDF